MIVFLLLLFLYIICGFFAYGLSLAYFVGEHPKDDPKDFPIYAFFVSLTGPYGFLISIYNTQWGRKHGLRWRIRQ